MTIKETIARLRELDKISTQSPWVGDVSAGIIEGKDKAVYNELGPDKGETAFDNWVDMELICYTRNALPELLEYIQNLEAVAEAAKNLKTSTAMTGTEVELRYVDSGWNKLEAALKKLEG